MRQGEAVGHAEDRRCRKPGSRSFLLCASLAVAGLLFTAAAGAHDARPLSVNITEQSKDLYVARVRVPPTVEADDRPRLVWPDGCSVLRDEARGLPDVPRETIVIGCKGGLEGRSIKVEYPIYNPSLSTLFRLRAVDGHVLTRVLTPDRMEWVVPEQPGWRKVAADYVGLGIRHIWTGLDHLLFVTALLILAATMRRTLLAVTGFTIAHSVTLSLSALDVVRLPVVPVEAAIALSILFLAREIASPHRNGLAQRYPIVVSSSFGLLHGFGFAQALREAGLPTRELAVGLLSFNAGVEIGQLVFIAGVLALVGIGRELVRRGALPVPRLRVEHRLALLGGYGLGIPAAFWFVQRLAAF